MSPSKEDRSSMLHVRVNIFSLHFETRARQMRLVSKSRQHFALFYPVKFRKGVSEISE